MCACYIIRRTRACHRSLVRVVWLVIILKAQHRRHLSSLEAGFTHASTEINVYDFPRTEGMHDVSLDTDSHRAPSIGRLGVHTGAFTPEPSHRSLHTGGSSREACGCRPEPERACLIWQEAPERAGAREKACLIWQEVRESLLCVCVCTPPSRAGWCRWSQRRPRPSRE